MYLSANVEGLHSGHECCPGRGAVVGDVVLLQGDAVGGQLVDGGGQHLRVVVADVVPAGVVDEGEDDVGPVAHLGLLALGLGIMVLPTRPVIVSRIILQNIFHI